MCAVSPKSCSLSCSVKQKHLTERVSHVRLRHLLLRVLCSMCTILFFPRPFKENRLTKTFYIIHGPTPGYNPPPQNHIRTSSPPLGQSASALNCLAFAKKIMSFLGIYKGFMYWFGDFTAISVHGTLFFITTRRIVASDCQHHRSIKICLKVQKSITFCIKSQRTLAGVENFCGDAQQESFFPLIKVPLTLFH